MEGGGGCRFFVWLFVFFTVFFPLLSATGSPHPTSSPTCPTDHCLISALWCAPAPSPTNPSCEHYRLSPRDKPKCFQYHPWVSAPSLKQSQNGEAQLLSSSLGLRDDGRAQIDAALFGCPHCTDSMESNCYRPPEYTHIAGGGGKGAEQQQHSKNGHFI